MANKRKDSSVDECELEQIDREAEVLDKRRRELTARRRLLQDRLYRARQRRAKEGASA